MATQFHCIHYFAVLYILFKFENQSQIVGTSATSLLEGSA